MHCSWMRDRRRMISILCSSKQADLTEPERRVELVHSWHWRAWAEHTKLSLEQSKVIARAFAQLGDRRKQWPIVYISDSYKKELIDVCRGLLPRIHCYTINTRIEHLMVHS